MIQRGGSDLHLKGGRPPAGARPHGTLQVLHRCRSSSPEELKALAESLMTPRQLAEFNEAKEADFGIGVPGIGRFRTNVYLQRGSIAFVFRAIPYEVRTVRELLRQRYSEEIAAKPRGLVLVTGITGSGKSTALAAIIDHINRNRRVNIITIRGIRSSSCIAISCRTCRSAKSDPTRSHSLTH